MSFEPIIIRPFKNADFKVVTLLWYHAKKQAFPYSDFQQRLTPFDDECYFRDTILMKCDVWIATAADQILGFMAMENDYIDQLFIDISHQRQGVGTVLLNKAKEISPAYLRLHTFQQNTKARNFYEKHGFQVLRFGVSAAPESIPDVEYGWWPRTMTL